MVVLHHGSAKLVHVALVQRQAEDHLHTEGVSDVLGFVLVSGGVAVIGLVLFRRHIDRLRLVINRLGLVIDGLGHVMDYWGRGRVVLGMNSEYLL